ncbi:alpha/beta fold hydrolase [Bradyrhizobium sp.]|uniref:alpha/beta fold hydrolase n=1 Tax=Bradyrhizobium sp. TaxID=376 RepID=UPI0040384C01
MLLATNEPTPATRTRRIDAGDGVCLGMLEKPAGRIGASGPPVLLVHGATLGAALFDIGLPGYSLMSEFSRRGRPVYAVDIRGYGSSLSGATMDAPPADNPPFARLDDAVSDVGAASAFVRERSGSASVDLVGFSWGSVVAAAFAGRRPERVRRLVLYAPLFGERNDLWRARIGDPGDPSRISPDIGCYRLISRDDIRKRWDADIGSDDPDRLRAPEMPDAVFDALAGLDPLTGTRSPPAFRSPAGALADLIQIFNGKPLYDPARISTPTLLVRGADDTTSTDADSKNLLRLIASASKDYQVITPGSHFLCVERNRQELYDRIAAFFERPMP